MKHKPVCSQLNLLGHVFRYTVYWLLPLTWSLNFLIFLFLFLFSAGCKGTVSVWSHLPPPEPTRKRLFRHQICGPRQAAGMLLAWMNFNIIMCRKKSQTLEICCRAVLCFKPLWYFVKCHILCIHKTSLIERLSASQSHVLLLFFIQQCKWCFR